MGRTHRRAGNRSAGATRTHLPGTLCGLSLVQILTELVDEIDHWHVKGQRSLHLVDRFEEFRRANPRTNWNADMALVVVTAESMRSDPHSIAAELFQHHQQPQFCFSPVSRNCSGLLLMAWTTSRSRNRSLSACPLSSAVGRTSSNGSPRSGRILSSNGEGTRGVQKRQRILSHVRKHPQELRPFNSHLHSA